MFFFFNKYVHELVTIDTDFIDARFNYETVERVLESNTTVSVEGEACMQLRHSCTRHVSLASV